MWVRALRAWRLSSDRAVSLRGAKSAPSEVRVITAPGSVFLLAHSADFPVIPSTLVAGSVLSSSPLPPGRLPPACGQNGGLPAEEASVGRRAAAANHNAWN
nr:hypothetical protein CPAG_06209 [Coccidioides posadasii RMSCC 3488]